MKDYDRERPGADSESAPQKKLALRPRETGTAEAAAQSAVSSAKTDAEHTDPPAILQGGALSHPANAGKLAGILSDLQQSHGNAYVQQVVSGMNEQKPAVEAPTSTGQTLDDSVKTEMESAFGESFHDVRVHTGAEAEKMNEELGARAVTRGRDIYFDAGEYSPATREGRELLAHELTHVVQQRGGSQSASVNEVGDAFEREAERNASAIMRGERADVRERGSAAPAFQRQAAPGQQRPAAPAPPASVANFTVVMLRSRQSGDVGPVHFSTNFRPGAPATSAYIRLNLPQAMSLTPIPVQNVGAVSTSNPIVTRDKQEVSILLSLRTSGGTPIIDVVFRQGTVSFTIEFQF
ncbi:MAG TPA: DUF4157 domain-containing protein [Pyrinomonadaceae bacterium]|nr:DUF4157 domain-containing protein [Pyrinomonadaceae bacterium]